MRNKLEQLKKEIFNQLEKIEDGHVLRDLEIKYLGRKGELTLILRGIADLAVEEKKKIGKMANEIKKEIQEKFIEIKNSIESKAGSEFFDPTLPGEKINKGHLHPLSAVQNELEDLFLSLGFMIMDGPELESDYYNFEALNIPAHHPARDMQDTFYIERRGATNSAHSNEKWSKSHPIPAKERGKQELKSDMVMRTHTSPVQIRTMRKYGAPLRMIVPGRAFRCEEIDACHEHSFFQIEGLMIDKGISIVNFKAVVKEMLSGIFKEDVNIRIRPGFFPFVEPGFEVDMSCTICAGQGCPSCKHGGWLEMGGAGMVHPNVLKYGNIDPEEYSGFAFGFGWDRLAMMKFGINDIRLFQAGDLRFLKQF